MSHSQSGRGTAPHRAESPPAIEAILRPYQGRKGVLLEIFHRIQEAYGYVPEEAMAPIARTLRMHAPTVYGTLTFYTEFLTAPPPSLLVEQCLGPTCHMLGAKVTKEILCHRLGIGAKGSDADNTFGWREIECAGHCHLAPLLYLNGEVRAQVGREEAIALADEAQARAGANRQQPSGRATTAESGG